MLARDWMSSSCKEFSTGSGQNSVTVSITVTSITATATAIPIASINKFLAGPDLKFRLLNSRVLPWNLTLTRLSVLGYWICLWILRGGEVAEMKSSWKFALLGSDFLFPSTPFLADALGQRSYDLLFQMIASGLEFMAPASVSQPTWAFFLTWSVRYCPGDCFAFPCPAADG